MWLPRQKRSYKCAPILTHTHSMGYQLTFQPYPLFTRPTQGPGCMLLAVVYVILWAISWGIVAAWSYCFKFMFKEARRGCRQAWITTAAYIRTMGELGQAFAKQPGGQLPEYRPIYTRHYNELRENVKKKLAEARRNTSKGAAAGAVLSVYRWVHLLCPLLKGDVGQGSRALLVCASRQLSKAAFALAHLKLGRRFSM